MAVRFITWKPLTVLCILGGLLSSSSSSSFTVGVSSKKRDQPCLRKMFEQEQQPNKKLKMEIADVQNDVNQGEFTWIIRNFTRQSAKLYSEAFTVSSCQWIIAAYPKGNNTYHLSLYLEIPDSATFPDGWTRKAKCSFSAIDRTNNAHSITRGSTSSHHDGALEAEMPSLEEVEKAKQSLKNCLSDLFKSNMKERLSEALSTLSSARIGLSSEQQIAIETFRANFNDFTSDFLTFEQDNAELELHKLLKDQRFSAMKKCHETHILNKQLMDDLIKEEEEVKSKRDKLLSDWEVLLVQSEEAESGYKDEQKKVAEAEEKKRISEERLSRSTTAWSNLKAQFC
ncbi:uncharacterized protein LOC104425537 [Eucalyptus grandis]|uniref:uncharacterized protein LOC104425537 n=1 Tax=Eucalyptus grandis TaxID=71139 RepID=UPI00192EEEBD|nr:uncharacterized protein LOC104425537 [Eucalyptus grandis]